MIRVRFAPSPTGYLHIGGARTALFNWLYAKSQKGKFILRIEDTDINRSKKEYLDEILESLKWLGLDWDELYFQSKRTSLYKEYAQKALDAGKAYKEGEAIIFKVPDKTVKINDIIRGEIVFRAELIKDQVLIKSDGTPTYNFACVIDDSLLNITHIIRGDDHISNTPKQIVLYEAFGFPIPHFAHVPLILGEEGGRLSKRTGATAIREYRQMGYLPEALVNFLMLLGWSPKDNREILDIKEASKIFDIKKVNKTAAVFDLDKLNWINNQYLKNRDSAKLTDELIPMLVEKKFIEKDTFDRSFIISIVKLFQSRLTVLTDFIERADFFFLEKIEFESGAKEKYLSRDLSKEFGLLNKAFDGLKTFDVQSAEAAFRGVISDLGIKSSELVHPVRVALTGKTVGPGLFDVISVLGKERVIKRLNEVIEERK